MGHLLSRLTTGVRVARDGLVMLATNPVLLAVALIPTIVRVSQAAAGGGRPEGTLVSETAVGLLRFALALTILAVAVGWRPGPGAWRPPSLAGTGSAWSNPGFSWRLLLIDLAVYALIYGAVNLAIGLLTGEQLLGGLIPQLGPRDPSTASGMIVFGLKNLVVIPVATIHILWALRLIQLDRGQAERVDTRS